MSLFEVLDRLEAIYRRLVDSALSGARPDIEAIIDLRQEFALEYGNFLMTLGQDVDVIEHRALFDTLQQEMEAMRTRLMSYQFQWQPARMEAEPEDYLQAARRVAAMVEGFIEHTRSLLVEKGIGDQSREPTGQ